jgi:cellulose synthase/poly-beta-1,6-N-acetylglucosamine synthase-like glycosyltransferase
LFSLAFAAVFIGVHAVAMVCLYLEWRRGRRSLSLPAPAGEPPLISVVVPARNEAARIGPLLASLAAQSYPNIEYLFIDDRSTDATPRMLRDFAAGRPAGRVKIIELEANPGPNYKQFGLGRGLAAAAGEYVLLTDADCEMGPDWAAAMAAQLADPAVGVVLGPVFKVVDGRGFFKLYQAFDHAVRFMYLAATCGMGAPCGAFGNNLLIRRSVLDEIGGYTAVPYSVTEDAALVATVRSKSETKVRAALERPTRVLTQQEFTWRALVIQGLRWNNGGLFAPDLLTRVGFGALMFAISFGILATLALPFWPAGLWPFTMTVYAAMTMNTLASLIIAGDCLPKPRLRYVVQCLFTPAFFSLLTLLGVLRVQVKWKGATLN